MTGNVAVVIVNYRTPDMTLACVAALAKTKPDVRVVVVDGGSGDGSAEVLREGLAQYGHAHLIAAEINGGFGWANNQGMLHLLQGADPPEFIHLLNPDTLVEADAVAKLHDALIANPKAAAAGSQLVNPGGSLAGSAFRFPSVAREFFRGGQMNRVGQMLGLPDSIIRPTETTKVDWVTGASVMLRVEALKQVGLFDTGFFLYFEEVELMRRLSRAGWDVLAVPASRVMHVGGVATGMADAELHERTSIPDYMFASRRRFFALTSNAENATRAWLAGNRTLRILKALGVNSDRPSADAERAGMLKHGVAATPFDRTPAITHVTDKPHQPPAWMQAS